jgi:ABC-type long-subunit fatty acid transport system fused permease/ATPase subunit
LEAIQGCELGEEDVGTTPHTRRRHLRLSLGMPLLNVVLTLIVVGVVLWLINTYIPMQATIKSILNIVVVIVVVLWLLYGFGILNHSGDIHMPVMK